MRLIDTKVSRETGSPVSVFDAEGWQELPEPGFRWVVRCDEHLFECWVENRREAQNIAQTPTEFCTGCANEEWDYIDE